MPSYKLYYFNAYGRAEVHRFLFHMAGIEYEDVRIDFADWMRVKKEKSFHQVPVLEVDGKRLTQSVAIARYLAKEFGIYGMDNWECALIDSFMDTCQEIIEKATVVIVTFDPQQKIKKKEEFNAAAPKLFEELENLLKTDEYFAGDRITVADLFFLGAVTIASQFATNCLQKAPRLAALHTRIEAHPKVAEWIKIRPPSTYST